MQEYVCGFMFDELGDDVLLIRKNKPDWQKGKLNGIGGKIEIGEFPERAMEREFKEEVGIECNHWDMFCILTGEDYKVYFFKTFCADIESFKQMEEEVPKIVHSSLINENVLPNLKWLVPMALYDNMDIYKIEELKFK